MKKDGKEAKVRQPWGSKREPRKRAAVGETGVNGKTILKKKKYRKGD